jgi:hypothetical protein
MTNAKNPMGSVPVAPKQEVQSLPQDNDLQTSNPETPAEKLKRLQREGELNKVPPEPDTNIGPDTTGVGQPSAQAVNQGQSLPAASVPVEKKLEGKAEQFYDPMDTERAKSKKDRTDRGGQKADF